MKRTALFSRVPRLAVLAVAAGLVLSASVASAAYFVDGSTQNGATGTWNLPTDFVCIKGIDASGNITVATGITSSRDCIYYTTGLTGMNPVDVTAGTPNTCYGGGTNGSKVCATAADCPAPSTGCGPAAAGLNFCVGGTSPGNTCNVPGSPGDCPGTGAQCVTAGTYNSYNCTGTSPITGGTLVWNSTSSKCYDQAPCLVSGFAAGTYAGVVYPANSGGKHSIATTICVDGSGNGLSLTGLDRTAQMCAARGGIWKQTSSTAPAGFPGTFPTANFGGACVAYGRQFKGQDANGTPLAFGAKGTSQTTTGAGYCYTTMNMTTAYGTQAACPSNKASVAPFDADAAYDWSWSSSKCTYAKGIAGYLNSTLTHVDGTTTGTTAGTWVDLSVLAPTMGDCLALGASWSNWIGQAASTTSVPTTIPSTIPAWNYTKNTPDADQGCLHCHSTTVEYNGPAERFKSSYLMTGHKNMLRKATANKVWAGPDADGVLQIYTAYAAGTIDWTGPTATVSGNPQSLLYIFGDWMAPAPAGLDVIVNISGQAKYNGTSNYSCAPCHSTGWSDNGSAPASRIGLCVPSSGGTNQAACTGAGGTWYPAIGVKGIGNSAYVPQEPLASFPSVTFPGAGQWDVEGITCARCHNAAVGITNAAMIAASPYKTTYPSSGGMGNIPGGPSAAGDYGVFVCYGCHQSIAKNNSGVGADNDLAHPENLPVKNSVATGTCSDPSKTSESACQSAGAIWTPTAYIPMFNGHVIGGSFLNSVHAEATSSILPNSLGKYDLVTNLACTGAGAPYACCTGAGAGTCTTYLSTFKGYTCWQSSSSSSPALTWIDSSLTTLAGCEAAGGEWESAGCVREIKDKTTCEGLYGAGAWRAASNGSCVTCHDVHNSLFVAGQEEKALRKTCQNCHVDNAITSATATTAPQVAIAGINHLTGSGTPFDTSIGESPCIVCHMPKPTSGDFPMHVWRINTDVNYSTFPSAAEYGAGTVPTKKIANTAPFSRNDDCTAAATPLPCCTGLGTGTCTYNNAVWVDLDLACGQCHGGGEVEDATHQPMVNQCTGVGTPFACCSGVDSGSCGKYRTKEELAVVADGMHNGGAVTYPTTFSASVSGTTVNMTASVTCNGCSLTYVWDCGAGGTLTQPDDTLPTASCVYGGAGPKTITLTVQEGGSNAGTATRTVTVTAAGAAAPVPGGLGGVGCPNLTVTAGTWAASFTDASTPSGSQVVVDWGDGTRDINVTDASFNHTYAMAGSYLVIQKVINSALQLAVAPPCTVTLNTYSISGTITKSDGTTPLGGATVSVKSASNGVTVKTVYTYANGTFSVGSVKPGDYWLVVSKRGYTFPAPTMAGNPVVSVAGNVSGILIKANP